MQAFTELYTALDETTKTSEKTAALVRYFAKAPPGDAAWALYFLIGRRPRQPVTMTKLRAWAVEAAGVPDWLFGECYDAVGDFAETVALILPDGRPAEDQGTAAPRSLGEWIEHVLLPLRDMDEATQREVVLSAWAQLGGQERFVWNKLITGAFRVGVSQRLVTRALAEVSGADADTVAHRLMGAWEPSPEFYAALLAQDTSDADISRPYPFCLAYPIEDDPSVLGDIGEWQAEWKWDGIRSQLVRRAGRTFVWSRGEELVTERFPELVAAGTHLPDGCVIDGEILPFRDAAVLPFAQLQRRIGRKTLGKTILSEVPVVIVAYDLLEWQGDDIRGRSLAERRALLERLVLGERAGHEQEEPVAPGASQVIQRSALPSIVLSPIVEAGSWEALAQAREHAREHNAEGLMIKRRDSIYRVGRQRGDWWKWKVVPYTVDAVLVYAQRGSGKRASLYSDYTFAVWDGDQLVPFTRAYSGLTDEEIRRVDAYVRRSTVDKFGPVRTVTPELVFELAFEGLQRSNRHKSGIAVRFPRMLRWRTDKRPEDADSIETIRAMLPPEG
jgi:DNA ligase-1